MTEKHYPSKDLMQLSELDSDQKEALNYSNKLFNFIVEYPFDKVMKMQDDPDKAKKALNHIMDWMNDGSFQRSGFFVSFHANYTRLIKYKQL